MKKNLEIWTVGEILDGSSHTIWILDCLGAPK